MRTAVGLFAGVAWTLTAYAGAPVEMPPFTVPPVDPAEVIATVNGTPIREWQVIEEADTRINAQNARDEESGLVFEESRRRAARDSVRQDVVHALIERELIAQRLERDGIEVTDAEVEARFAANSRAQNQNPGEARREMRLRRVSLRCVEDRIRWNTLGVEKLYDAYAKNKRVLTEAQALQEYTKYPAEFDVEEERRVSHILFAVPPEASETQEQAARLRAEAALARIREGANFNSLAVLLSDDHASRSRGGDRGWSKRGIITGPTDDPFGNVAFAMRQVGNVSEVVETRDGFHIIKLTGIKEARRKSFAEARDEMMAKFRYLEIEQFWATFGRELWQAATIELTPAEQARRAELQVRQKEFNRQVEEMIARERAK